MQKTWFYFPILLFIFCLNFQCSKEKLNQDFEILKHELDIKIEFDQYILLGKDKLTLTSENGTDKIALFINSKFSVDSVFCEGRMLDFKLYKEFDSRNFIRKNQQNDLPALKAARLLSINIDDDSRKECELEIFFHGPLKLILQDSTDSVKSLANQVVISLEAQNAALLSGEFWYPTQLNALSTYQITVLTPSPYEVVTVGKLVSRILSSGSTRFTIFETTHPTKPISLFIGPYNVSPFVFGSVQYYAYLFPHHTSRAAELLETATRSLEAFNRIIGPYAFEKFAIVASPFPMNQTFSSFCTIDTSQILGPGKCYSHIGNLVCHNWFGEGIYIKPNTGNWANGLVTYLNEHYLLEEVDPVKTVDIRYHHLREYSIKINPQNDVSLNGCWDADNPVHRTISTSKGMMLYHRLKSSIDETFINAIQDFYKANQFKYVSWDELKPYFEKNDSTDLGNFFQIWLKGKGAPQFSIANVRSERVNKEYIITGSVKCNNFGTINDNPKNPIFDLSVEVTNSRERVSEDIHITADSTQFNLKTTRYPEQVTLDPKFNIFRRLYPEEIQPYIGEVLQSEKKLIVLPGTIRADLLKAYRNQIQYFVNESDSIEIKFDHQVRESDLQQNNIILFGGFLQNSLTARVHQTMSPEVRLEHDCFVYKREKLWKPPHALISTLKNPVNPRKTILFYWGMSENAILESAQEICDLQNYGFVILRDGMKATWKQWDVLESPMIHKFEQPRSSRRGRRR